MEKDVISSEKPVKPDPKKNLVLEILRFAIVGGGATIIDFCFGLAVKAIIGGRLDQFWIETLAVIVGFLVSTVFNYFLSVIWVFKNVNNEKRLKTRMQMLLFVVFSAVGLGIGIGLQNLGAYVCMSSWSIDISNIGFTTVFSQNAGAFWSYAVVFVIKTTVTLVYNYLSRKFFLFPAPKQPKNV
jgi:GtrA-like protein.